MKRKYKIIVSLILFVLSIVLVCCGIALFNILPEVNTNGYTNPKDALVMTGVTFSFLFGLGALGLSIGFLIMGFTED